MISGVEVRGGAPADAVSPGPPECARRSELCHQHLDWLRQLVTPLPQRPVAGSCDVLRGMGCGCPLVGSYRDRGPRRRQRQLPAVTGGYPCLVRSIVGVEIDVARLAAICDRYGIAELQLFGSQARGTATADSDIDILYTLRPGRRLGWDIEQLADDLTDLFGRPVDLVSIRGLHPLLRSSVLAEARPVYAA